MTDTSSEKGELPGQNYLAQPWLLTTVLMHLASVWIYSRQEPINAFEPLIYAVGISLGVSVWLLLNIFRDTLGRTGRIAFGTFLAPVAAAIVVGNYFFYLEFGEFFSASMFKFAMAGNMSMSLHYAAGYLDYPFNLVFMGGLAAFASIWAFGKPVRFATPAGRRAAVSGSVVFFVAALLAVGTWGPRKRLSPDAALFSAIARSTILPKANSLRAADREEVEELERGNEPEVPDEPPNIVLVVNESWAKRHVGFYGADEETMPFLAGWLRRETDTFLRFDRAYTNATATELSMPTIITGVGAWESGRKLHTMPMAWEWARSAGLQPFFLAAQSYDFLGYGEYFFGRESIPYKTPDDVRADSAENFGTDELAIAEHFDVMLREETGGDRFFGIYNSNALHKPFQAISPRLKQPPPFDSAQRNALYIIDRAMQDIVGAIREAGEMDETIFIFTSDHGELPSRRHLPPRVVSFYDEFTNIPFLIRVPPSWKKQHPDRLRALRRNTGRNVANIDIVPTLIHALGYRETDVADRLRNALQGSSLFEPVPTERTLIALNTNDIRRWEHEGFGLYWRDWRLVFSDIEGVGLFDISRDPDQQTNLWEEAPERVRDHFRRVIQANHELRRIWTKYRRDKG